MSSNISDETFNLIVSNCRFLEIIDVGFCESITSLKNLANAGHAKISHINLVGCRKVFIKTGSEADLEQETVSHYVGKLVETCENLSSIRVGPIHSNRLDMRAWTLLGSIEEALASIESGRSWTGTVVTERYFLLQCSKIRRLKQLMAMNAEKVDLMGLRPLYTLLNWFL